MEKDTLPYLDPSNVNKNSTEYFQFLKLSSSAGLHVAEVNQKILYDKGIFKGKASSFIQAAKDHNINEIYLISHAMLETGNGTSDLAKGGTYNGKKVYNMYGIGAADSCNSPYQCGLKFAYDQDWTTPEKAIVGGAKFIADRYINKGQDTLYKMKWNPEAMVKSGVATHQYATDIAWAEKQTYNIKKYYDLLDNYSLIFDVPVYK
ncbi:N-acetylglucosaminidase [Paracerasibacillus soli]|uniref:N-acetylglucosaminidase n=1 Tax=Paracerasibacillus soli TaxID=480284 RepID=UPI00387E1541